MKMRKWVVFAFVVVGMSGAGYAREMPEKVRRFLESYTRDSTAHRGPLRARDLGYFDNSVQIKDLRVGRIIEVYQLKHIFLDAYPDTVPFSELIEPTGHWLVLITAHNKPVYELFLTNTEEGPRFRGMGPLPRGVGVTNMWEQLLKTYPMSTGINPIFFSRYGHIFGQRERFLYFEQKGPRKIYYARPALPGSPAYDNDPLKELFPASMEILDDSRKLIEYWKQQGLNEVGIHGYNRVKTGGER